MLLPTNKGKGNICRNRPDPKTLGFRRGLLVTLHTSTRPSTLVLPAPASGFNVETFVPAARKTVVARLSTLRRSRQRSIGTHALAHGGAELMPSSEIDRASNFPDRRDERSGQGEADLQFRQARTDFAGQHLRRRLCRPYRDGTHSQPRRCAAISM